MAIKLVNTKLGACDENHVRHIIKQFIIDLDADLENQPEATRGNWVKFGG